MKKHDVKYKKIWRIIFH